jgi:hypothetical protein
MVVFNARCRILLTEVPLSKLTHEEGHAVAYLIEALCYTLEGRGFDSQ